MRSVLQAAAVIAIVAVSLTVDTASAQTADENASEITSETMPETMAFETMEDPRMWLEIGRASCRERV